MKPVIPLPVEPAQETAARSTDFALPRVTREPRPLEARRSHAEQTRGIHETPDSKPLAIRIDEPVLVGAADLDPVSGRGYDAPAFEAGEATAIRLISRRR